jgi:hypothetical protein
MSEDDICPECGVARSSVSLQGENGPIKFEACDCTLTIIEEAETE